jgi:hypothetical protein
MSPPVVKNVCKSAREQDGYKSFSQWFDDEKNVYIGRNAAKYVQRGVLDSKWSNPFLCLDWDASKADWLVEEIMKIYEKYVRKNVVLMNSLHELEGKELGCWCKPGVCHGDILVKLYNEKYGEQPTEKRRKTVF